MGKVSTVVDIGNSFQDMTDEMIIYPEMMTPRMKIRLQMHFDQIDFDVEM